MRFLSAEDALMKFDDGTTITSDYSPICCEYNYADFSACVDDELRNNEFDSIALGSVVEDAGFNLIIKGLPHKILGKYDKTYFVPCYSEQNGYYSNNLTIYINNIPVCNLDAELAWR